MFKEYSHLLHKTEVITMIALGIDIGGTYIKYGLVNENAQIIQKWRENTSSSLPELLNQIVTIIHQQQKNHTIEAIGIGIPGFISHKKKKILCSPNIHYLDGVNFASAVRKQSGFPVIVENDANLAAYGEFSLIPPPRPRSFIHLTLGTGVGSGIILNRKIWTGEDGYAGELGHVVVNPSGRKCGCGGTGCIETEASALGIITTYTELAGLNESELTAADIFQLSQQGDEIAQQAFIRAGICLGRLISIIVTTLNPTLISIGGGVAAAREALVKPLMTETINRIGTYRRGSIHIVFVSPQRESGIIGAALWASCQSQQLPGKKKK